MSEKNQEKSNFAWELGKTIISVLLFVAIFRFFIIQPFFVIGSSMEPTYHNGDYLFVNELTYQFSHPKRGDVIVFRHPEPACTAFVNKSYIIKNVFEGPCQSYIKRVIAVPGEKVQIQDGNVTIFNSANPNGLTLKEDYIAAGVKTLGNQTVTLEKNKYFVLGDNREPNASSDSREWGPLDKKYIIGKVFVRIFNIGNNANAMERYSN